MTGPVTTEALVAALADYWRIARRWPLSTASDIARDLVAGPLAPLLAAHQQQAASIGSLEESVNGLEAALQQVTTERDAEKARADRIDAKLGELNAAVRECLPPVDTLIAERQAAEASLATATSELARLRAEGEELRQRLTEKGLPAGPCLWGRHPKTGVWHEIDDGSHTDAEVTAFERDYAAAGWTDLTRANPFARAATAREGQADG